MPGTTRQHSHGFATALQRSRPAPAGSYLGPAPRLRPLKHQADKSLAPAINPVAAVLPRLAVIVIQSVTSLNQKSFFDLQSPYVPASRRVILSVTTKSQRFPDTK